MKIRGEVLAVLLILNLVLVGASFDYENRDLIKKYRAGEMIKGWINISFEQEEANNLLRSNFQGNISLIDFLKKNGLEEGDDFECDSADCKTKYSLESELSNIDLNGNKVIGMKIEGDSIERIDSFSFTLKSNIQESCSEPLVVNLFGNNLSGTSYVDRVCSDRNYGCFNRSAEHTNVLIEDSEICEQIVVNPAPAYRIGARVLNTTGKKGKLKMIAYDLEGESYSCDLPEHKTNDEELECIIKTGFSKKQNLSVCITNTAFSSGSDYKIKSESRAPVCGTSNRDFYIFATNLGYNSSNIVINESSLGSFISLKEQLYDYLEENYLEGDKISCSPCIVPIFIKGGQQNIEIKDINLVFRDGGLTIDDSMFKKVYGLSSRPSLIESGNLKLDLEHAGFTIPLGTKDKRFKLYLGDEVVFEENIEIEDSFNFSLNTQFVFVGIETKLEAVTSFNISSSKWDFGDGKIEEVSGKSISHTFKENKQYLVKVELKRNDGVIAIKTFQVVSGNPKESANKTLFDYEKRIISITRELDKFPDWTEEEIESGIEIDKINQTLKRIRVEYDNSSSDVDYTRVVNSLLDLKLPISIFAGKKGSLPIAVGAENIDVNYLEEVYSNFSKDSDLKERPIGWMNQNYDVSIKFEEISALYSDGVTDPIANIFDFSISPKEASGEAYFFIDYPLESITFEKNYGQKSVREDAGGYISIKPEIQNIRFLILGEVDVAGLASYLAPVQKEQILSDGKKICDSDDPNCKIPYPWKKVSMWILLIVFVVFVIYIIMQEWYKRSYEHYLFKDGRDLYNIVNFIYNSRVSNLSDNEIKKSLKDAGWNGEKISFAFKKIDGKRTGMWEIPIFKMFENRKVRKELEKRHGGSIDIKFIKQPRF